MYIKKCSDFFSEIFSDIDDWQEDYIDLDLDDIKDFEDLSEKLISFTDEFFLNLHLSILTGEFISNSEYLDDLKRLEELLSALHIDYGGASANINLLASDLNEQVTKPFLFIIERCRHLHSNTKNKLKNLRKNSYLYNKLNSSPKAELLIIATLQPNLKLLNYNFELCSIDRSLVVSKETYQNLLFIIADIKVHFNTYLFQQPLVDKASFLLKKLEFRFKDDDLSYEINFSDVSAPEIIEPFTEWLELIKEHYEEIGRISFKFREGINNLNGNSSKEFRSFHKLVKHYKDDDTRDDISQKFIRVENLSKEFKKTYKGFLQGPESLLSNFNRKAYQVSLNYHYNNLLSIAVQENTVTEEKLFSVLSKINKFQNESDIQNYFHYQKIAEYYSRKVELAFSGSEKNLVLIENIILKLENYLHQAEKNFQWCSNRNYYIYQSPFQECLVNYNLNEDIVFPMFIYSSFTLPLNYDFKNSGIYPIKQDLTRFKLLLGFHKNIEQEMEIIESNRRSIANSEKKNIEILSIFSAVVLFAFGEIQMFQNLKGKELYTFSLLFAYSLIMFVLVIWLITRDYPVTKKYSLPWVHQALIGFMILVTCILLYKILY